MAVRIDLARIQALAAGGAYGGIFTLGGESVALCLSWLALLFHWNWIGAGWDLTPAEKDAIDAMIAEAVNDLMQPMEGGVMLIATVVAHAGGNLPDGYLRCNGQLYDRVDYPLLYAALHSTYIENDDEFRTPDLRGRTAIGEGTGYQLTPRDMNDMGGVEEHELTAEEMPEHQHQYDRMTLDAAGTFIHGSGYAKSENTSTATLWSGLGHDHETMQPWTAVRYIIKADDV